MDVTTLALAVDSSAVNSASVALREMAAQGLKAETVAAKFANTAQAQGRAINSGIVKNAAAAADSIRGLTGATSALAGAQDFSRTTAGLAAAATQANMATGAVRAFSAAIAASAAAGGGLATSFQAPKAATVQQIAQAPVSALSRSSTAAGSTLMTDIDSKPTVTATNALDKYADQAGKAKIAAEALTSATQEQGRTLAGIAPGAAGAATGLFGTASAMSEAAVKANAAAAAFANASAAAARAGNDTKQFNAFSGLGVAASAAVPTAAPAQTSAFSAAAANASKQVSALGQANKMTAEQARQLSFQMNDFFVQVASGQSVLTAAIQQGSQLSGTFNGIGGAVKAVGSLITPMTVGVTAAATAVGTLGYAFLEGQKQSKAFADSLVLSGNFAGQTEGMFSSLAKKIAESGQVTVGATREYAQALIATGEIGPQVLGLATEAAAKYGAATGKTAQEVAADFAKMSRAPSEFAKEANRSLNNLTAPLYSLMKGFEENGKAVDSQAVFYRSLIDQMNKLEPNLTRLDRILRDGKTAWSNFWDAATDSGRADTTEAKLSSIAARIAAAQRSANDAPSIGAYGGPRPSGQSVLSGLLAEQAALQKQQASEVAKAAEQAQQAATQKSGIAAKDYIDKALKAAKASSALNEELAENARQIKAAAAAGIPYSKEEAALLDKNTRKKFAGSKGPANSEASQVLREQLGEDMSAFKIALDAEKSAIAFQQRELQGLYQAGSVSLVEFFDGKRKAIADGVAAETSELDKEIARLKEYQAAIKDPSEKVKIDKQINQVTAQKERVGIAGGRETVLIDQEAKAALKALDDQVTNYRANLLQMAGDELGAARLRAEAAKTAAGSLAGQAGGRITAADIERQSTLAEIANQYADAQRRAGDVAQNTARAEEAAYLVAEQGGKSLLETESAVYAVRNKAADQLGILATKARELAEASTDPKIKQFAADLALQYANAVDKMDPALQRLRGMQRDLASSITGSIDSGIAGFGQNYIQRREQQARDKLQGGKGESSTTSALKTIQSTVIAPMAGNITATLNKALVTDPLQKYLEKQLRGMTEGDGLLAGVFKDALGIKDQKVDPKMLAEQAAAQATNALSSSVAAQTAAADASTAALNALATAANAAAGASPSRPLLVEAGARQASPSMGDFTRADRALGDGSVAADSATAAALIDARTSTERFADTAKSAGTVVTALAASAGKGSSALGLLPSVVNLFQASVAAMKVGSAASGGSGLFGSIAGLFGGSSGTGALATNSAGMAAGQGVSADALANLLQYGLAEGGLVKGPGTGKSDSIPARLSNGEFVMPAEQTKAFLPVLEQMRSGSMSAFASATRYHTGGIVGQKPDEARSALAAAALKVGEVPAILMKNEEVLRADDPRHRDNLGADVFAKIMAGEKPWAHSLAAQAATQAPDSSVGSLLKNIAGDTKQGGENSASVLGGLLSRLGVQDESATASAIKVHGARELGGPVSAGKLYRVNEKRPELLNVGNRQYLMMGSQGGKVDPNPQTGPARPIEVTNNFHLGAPTNHSTQRQMALAASRSISDAARRNG